MKSISYAVLILLSTGQFALAIDNTWTDIGPYVQDILSLAINPSDHNVVYVGSHGGGFFVSTNAGESWLSANRGLGSAHISAIAPDPQNEMKILTGTLDNSIFMTENSGESWTKVGESLDVNTVYTLLIDPNEPRYAHCGTAAGGLYTSTDGGLSWDGLFTGVNENVVRSIVADPLPGGPRYAALLGPGGGLFRSSDYGQSWNHADEGLDKEKILSVEIDETNPAVLFSGSIHGVIYRSLDAAENWDAMFSPLPDTFFLTLEVSPTNPDIVYAGAYGLNGGIFKSDDGGDDWSSVNTNFISNEVFTLSVHPGNADVVYAGTNMGLYKTTDGGDSWRELGSGMMSATINQMTFGDLNTLYVAASDWQGGLYQATDLGEHWMKIGSSELPQNVYCFHYSLSEKVTYVGTDRGIYRSFDDGATFDLQVVGLGTFETNWLGEHPGRAEIMLAGTSSGLYASSDQGASWAHQGHGLETVEIYDLIEVPIGSGDLLVGASNGVYRSNDDGDTWRSTLLASNVVDIDSHPVDPDIVFACSKGRGVYWSNTGGASHWRKKNQGLTDLDVSALIVSEADANVLFVATLNEGLFKSTDLGDNWESYNNGLPCKYLQSLAQDPMDSRRLLVGTRNNGIYTYVENIDIPETPEIVELWTDVNGIWVEWIPNTEPDLAGYRIYIGDGNSTYFRIDEVAPEEDIYFISDLNTDRTYCVAMSAFDTANLESPLTEEYRLTPPIGGYERPTIKLAGYLATSITSQAGGDFTFFAVARDPDHAEDIEGLWMYYWNNPLGIALRDDGLNGDSAAGDGVYTFAIHFPPGAASGLYLFELVGEDRSGYRSDSWPYLTVKE